MKAQQSYIVIAKLKRNLPKFAAALHSRRSDCWNHSNYVLKLNSLTVATK